MRIEDALRGIAPFSHLSDEHLAALASCASRMRLPAGATLISEGDDGRDVYAVEEGEVRIERDTPYGRYALASLGAGELFGEASFVDSGARSSNALTRLPTQLLQLSAVAMSTLTAHDHRFALAVHWAFWRSLSHKLRATNNRLSQFFSESPGTGPHSAVSPADTPGSVRVGMAEKKELFSEQKLSAMEINFLASLSRELEYAPGEVIFREGDAGDKMYIVLGGRVMISKVVPGAGEEALSFLERGAYFGEMALIDKQPRSADAKAHSGGALVLAIPGEAVEGILDINKVGSLRLLAILCSLIAKRLREVDDKIVGWFILSGGFDPHSSAG